MCRAVSLDGEAGRETVSLVFWLVVSGPAVSLDGEHGREAVSSDGWLVVELSARMVRAWTVGSWSSCHCGLDGGRLGCETVELCEH